MNEKIIDFTLGADPEFCCSFKNSLVPASDWVDARDNSLDFGADGNQRTFEIRPAPSNNPLQVVNNIRDIFIRQSLKTADLLKFQWIAGSFYKKHPLGGHVHFGISQNKINYGTAIEFLDHYVGSISLLLEDYEGAYARRNQEDYEYGHMGGMRVQNWGFEYRPMSSWLTSPYVAAAILCLSKTVMYEVMNNSQFKWHKFVVADDFKQVRQSNIITKFPDIWRDITKMHLYQSYKPYLDFIYTLISNKKTWLTRRDMKDCWGIIDMKPCITTKFNVELLWNRFNVEQTQ